MSPWNLRDFPLENRPCSHVTLNRKKLFYQFTLAQNWNFTFSVDHLVILPNTEPLETYNINPEKSHNRGQLPASPFDSAKTYLYITSATFQGGILECRGETPVPLSNSGSDDTCNWLDPDSLKWEPYPDITPPRKMKNRLVTMHDGSVWLMGGLAETGGN